MPEPERLMPISFRERLQDTPLVVECGWSDLCAYIHGHAKARAGQRYSDKTQTPSVVFGRTEGTFQAHDIDPEGLHCLALDFDSLNYERAEEFCAFAALASLDGRYLIHTTWQHGITAHARMRVVLPLPEPVPAFAWPAYWGEAAAVFEAAGFSPDPVCCNFARCYFLPVSNPSAPEWAREPWVTYAN